MKNKFSKNKFGTVLSIALALLVAIAFWLVMKYIDSDDYKKVEGEDGNNTPSASVTDYISDVL